MSDATSKPAPAFPFAHNYGGISPTTETPNPFDLPAQFNNLNINQQSSGAPRPVPPRQNSDVNKPLPPHPPPPSYTDATRPPIPNVLTPGNRQGLNQAPAPAIDYLPPLRNPVPRPPQQIPIPEKGGYSSPNPYGSPSNYPPPALSAPPTGAYQGAPASSPPAASSRAASVPPATITGDGIVQCSGVTKAGKRCTRTVKAPAVGPTSPEDELPRYCHQHSREMLAVSGFYSRRNKQWVAFDDWIPHYLNEETKVLLRSQMETPISTSDVPGYIYCYELRDPANPEVIHLKVGRAVNLVKRIDQWTKSCGSKEPILRGWYPGPANSNPAEVRLMKGVVMAGDQGRNCHRLERLIHLELGDLVIFKPYLTPEFFDLKTPDEKSATESAKSDSPKPAKAKKERAAATPKKGKAKAATPKKATKPKKSKRSEDDEDDDKDEDDDDDDDDGDYKEDEEGDDDKPRAKAKPKKATKAKKSRRRVEDDEDEDEVDSNEGDDDNKQDDDEAADDSPPTPTKRASRAKKVKLLVRTPCKDCGQVHKEIFTFERPTSGSLKDHEWESIVCPVITKWGLFIDNYT